MATISRQFTTPDGETLTVQADAPERWTADRCLITPSAEEQGAVSAALQAFDEGRMDDVRTLLGPFQQDGLHPATLLTLARALAVEGDFDAAEPLLKRAEERFPQEPQVWKALAILHRLQGRAADELNYRRKLIFLVPKPAPGAYLAFALAYTRASAKDADPPLGELQFVSKKLTDRPMSDETARRERMAFAEQVYALKPMLFDAINHYRAASPLPEGARDVSVAWTPLIQWCQANELPCRRAVDAGRPGRRPTLAELQRVAVMPHLQWVPLLDEEKVAIDGFMTRRMRLQGEMPDSPLLMDRPARRAEIRMPRELPVIDQPALLLGGVPQYYHHTIEHLGSLAVAEMLDAPADLPLVVNDDLAPFQLELFALLGIDERRLLRVKADEPVRFARLWIPTRAVDVGRWIDPLIPRWYRERLVPPTAGPARRKVYLSQAQAGRRRIANDEAMTALLLCRGYEVVSPESLSVAQQIALFSEVSHIVAVAGAALTNMVYSPPGAQVVVLSPRSSVTLDRAPSFDALAIACGHSYAQLDCRPADLHDVDPAVIPNARVDLEALQKALG